eukprot:173676-Chlamydomonas_euryale.AAC.3
MLNHAGKRSARKARVRRSRSSVLSAFVEAFSPAAAAAARSSTLSTGVLRARNGLGLVREWGWGNACVRRMGVHLCVRAGGCACAKDGGLRVCVKDGGAFVCACGDGGALCVPWSAWVGLVRLCALWAVGLGCMCVRSGEGCAHDGEGRRARHIAAACLCLPGFDIPLLPLRTLAAPGYSPAAADTVLLLPVPSLPKLQACPSWGVSSRQKFTRGKEGKVWTHGVKRVTTASASSSAVAEPTPERALSRLPLGASSSLPSPPPPPLLRFLRRDTSISDNATTLMMLYSPSLCVPADHHFCQDRSRRTGGRGDEGMGRPHAAFHTLYYHSAFHTLYYHSAFHTL